MSFKTILLNLLGDGAVRRKICSIASACTSGEGTTATWGDITGDITNQSDLQAALATAGGDLQSVTDSGNTTSNALQVTDATGFDTAIRATTIYNYGVAINAGGVGLTTGTSFRRVLEYGEDAGTTNLYNDLHSQSLSLREQTGANAGIVASGRIQASEGINANDCAVMSQITTLGETSTTAYRGDRGKTAYDHSQIVDGTNPHATTFANIASLPTTISGFGITDGVSNLGNRSIAGLTTLGSSSIAATHTLTIPSVGTGWTHYNTVDQTTNYERVLGSWISNVYTIATGIGGTGTARALRMNAGVGSLTVGGTSSSGILNFGASASTANIIWLGVNGTMSASTGMQSGITMFNTINQSSTAGYRGLWISPTETGTGSGSKLLIDAGTGGTGAHVSKFSVDNSGNTIAAKYSVSSLNTAPASATDTGTTGEIRITADAIYVCTATNVWVRSLLTTF